MTMCTPTYNGATKTHQKRYLTLLLCNGDLYSKLRLCIRTRNSTTNSTCSHICIL